MKKKYKVTLAVIGVLMVVMLSISTSYGLWLSTNQTSPEKSATTLACFKVYFSNKTNEISMKNIDSVVNEEGLESSPYTLTITNICDTEKELQVRLNVLNESTIDTKALTIDAKGHIEKDVTLYRNLSNTKTTDKDVRESKMIGLIKVKPNETVRTNIKMWFDEKRAPIVDKKSIFKARFEIIDTESSIKATFAETLLNSKSQIDNKKQPSFDHAEVTNVGLYNIDMEGGKGYYYRGVVNNNYVRFADQLWRIVRINPDNTIRIVLDKNAGTTQYSKYSNAIDYSGYKYIYNNEVINNDITNYLNNWYRNNITNKQLDKYVAMSSYCNDSYNTENKGHTYFAGYTRVVSNKAPSLKCNQPNTDFGGKYMQKVGLLTADEVMLAGGAYAMNNFHYYLYNGENFYTATPADFFGGRVKLFTVTNGGAISTIEPTQAIGIRPVINLDAKLTVSGSGTKQDPYTIDAK